MADASRVEQIRGLLEALNNDRGLFVARLSEPLLAPIYSRNHQQYGTRSSDASSTGAETSEQPTPASLSAELAHYKDLFTKLRFSYTSQVTKELFLRSIIASPIQNVTDEENASLEARLAEAKSDLQRQKAIVADVLANLEERSRTCAYRHQRVQAEIDRLRAIPDEYARRKEELTQMRAKLDDLEQFDSRPGMALPLPATRALMEEQRKKLDQLEYTLEEQLASQIRENEYLKELETEMKRQKDMHDEIVVAADVAKGRKEKGVGGLEDEIEEQGRWLTAWEATLRELVPAAA